MRCLLLFFPSSDFTLRSVRMCLVRMRQEGREGKYMCRYIVHSMWEDVEQRSKIMGVSSMYVCVCVCTFMYSFMVTD